MQTKVVSTIAMAAALLAAASSSRAQTDWTGTVSSDWFTAGNWNAGVPTSATSANIDSATPNATVVGAAGATVQNLDVGSVGTGILTIQNGGTVSNVLGAVGNLAGSNGMVTVTGAGSSWTNSGTIVVGGVGKGILTIQNGGTVSSAGGGSVGLNAGSQGTVIVTGAGSAWNNSPGGGLNIGSFGFGTLTIASGGTVNNNTAFTANIGSAAGSQGTVIVTGTGSAWSNSSGLNVGSSGTGTLTIADNGTVTSGGPFMVARGAGSVGTLNIGASAGDPAAAPGTLNAANVAFGAGTGTLNFNHTSNNYIFAPAIGGNGSVNVLAGITILPATNTYTGATTINGGALIVNGSIASSSLTTVNGGAALLGVGTVGSTIINSGGFLAPGAVGTIGTLTVNGNLTFQPSSFYVVQVNPSTASNTVVSGTASLAGTVGAVFAPGTYMTRSYPILTATGGFGGTTFDGLVTRGLPAGFGVSVNNVGNTAFLNLRAQLVPEPPGPGGPTVPPPTIPQVPGLPSPDQPSPPDPPPGSGAALPIFTGNQLNVGRSIDNFFNNGGALPPAFVSLFNFTGNNLTSALDQLTGEAATGAQKVGFQLTDQFLNLLVDPFVDGRCGIGGTDQPPRANQPPLGFVRDCPPVYEPGWTAWGGGYGGGNRTTGNLATVGSHDLSASTFGFVGGFDYHYTPDTVFGFAFAGGGTNWSLSQGLGGGRSDAVQVGVYGSTKYGPAYLAAALAFSNNWMLTDRLAVGDHLTAVFNAQSYGGRLEGGYHFSTPYVGIAPYAAIQAQDFHTPGYNETDSISNGYALAFGARDATDTRIELGARFDRVLAVYSNAVLALRGRVAWAHDWVSQPTLTAAFQALPGSSFIVNGATLPNDSALASAGAELRLANGVTLLAKFDGAFASGSYTLAGTAAVRYRW